MDNVLIERLWRSLKHEDVNPETYAYGREAKAGIGTWITFYNTQRFHQARENRTPMLVWREGTAATAASGVGAVDMTDNATALTTFPQLQQTTASLAACWRLTSGQSPISRPAAVVLTAEFSSSVATGTARV